MTDWLTDWVTNWNPYKRSHIDHKKNLYSKFSSLSFEWQKVNKKNINYSVSESVTDKKIDREGSLLKKLD